MSVIGFFSRRLLKLIVSLVVLVSATFIMVRLIPGDPVEAALGEQATAEAVSAQKQKLGLNDPLGLQYLDYFKGLFTGNLGHSIVNDTSVLSLLAQRLPNTLELALPGFVLIVVLALTSGYTLALLTRGERHPRARAAFIGFTGVLNSIPDFVAGTMLTAIFAVSLEWLPVSGNKGAASAVLPIIALAIGPAATMARIVRVETLGVLNSGYVRAAKSRRLPASILHVRHVLPNMTTASLTYGSVLLGNMLAGTVLVENVFGWPGLGTVVKDSIVQKDYPVIQGALLTLGTVVLLLNSAVDILLGVLDPRSRLGS